MSQVFRLKMAEDSKGSAHLFQDKSAQHSD